MNANINLFIRFIKNTQKTTQKLFTAKRKIEEVRAKIFNIETVEFDSFKSDARVSKLHISFNIDIISFYALFSLFFEKNIYQTIDDSINSYA